MVTLGLAGIGPEDVMAAVGGGVVNGGRLLARENGRTVVSSGFRRLDALLPAGGVRRGSLIDWFAGDGPAGNGMAGGGAATLAFAIACRLAGASMQEGDAGPRTIVVVDRAGWFHPPAVLPWLTDRRRLVVARPSRDADEIWTIDQALRCPGVAAVLAWPRGTVAGRRGGGPRSSHGMQQWTTAMRRWQLAAASSGAVGLLVRPDAVRCEPSWAEARLAISPQASGRSGNRLLERCLRVAVARGVWSAADPELERSAEIVIDLARGVEGMARSAEVPEQAPIRRNDARRPGPPHGQDAEPRSGTGSGTGSFTRSCIRAGVACRAS